MLNKNTSVYYASSIAQVQTILKNVSGISIVAGATEIARRQTMHSLNFPANVLSIAKIPELCAINKTERYVEFGASVTLDTLLELGRKNVPEVLHECVEGIANPAIRTLATLGGNIAAKGRRLSTFAPLLALDAKLEIRSPLEAAWVPMLRYFSNTGREQTKRPELFSRIRVPTQEWDISIYRRIGRPNTITDVTSSFAFLVKAQKNVLADIRVVWAGKFFFRQREFENLMIGRTLPLSERDMTNLMDKADLFFDKRLFPESYERSCMLSLIEDSLRLLT
jgi:CO/xanthine dehydrogenase FAD-binding subunit